MKTGGENWTGNEDSVRKNKLILDCLSDFFLFEKWGIIRVVTDKYPVSIQRLNVVFYRNYRKAVHCCNLLFSKSILNCSRNVFCNWTGFFFFFGACSIHKQQVKKYRILRTVSFGFLQTKQKVPSMVR